jgi:hypothetical protein
MLLSKAGPAELTAGDVASLGKERMLGKDATEN